MRTSQVVSRQPSPLTAQVSVMVLQENSDAWLTCDYTAREKHPHTLSSKSHALFRQVPTRPSVIKMHMKALWDETKPFFPTSSRWNKHIFQKSPTDELITRNNLAVQKSRKSYSSIYEGRSFEPWTWTLPFFPRHRLTCSWPQCVTLKTYVLDWKYTQKYEGITFEANIKYANMTQLIRCVFMHFGAYYDLKWEVSVSAQSAYPSNHGYVFCTGVAHSIQKKKNKHYFIHLTKQNSELKV